MEIGFENYMTENFPNFSISKPVFGLANSLRFELGPECFSTAGEEYFNEAVKRATEITSFAMRNAENVFVVYQECTDGEELTFTPALLEAFNPNSDAATIFPYVEDNGEKLEWRRLIKKVDANDPLILDLVQAIINVDFPSRAPRLAGELYFVVEGSNSIINIYDDRGMDIAAKELSDLKLLYEKFNNLILEYDRKEVDEKFKKYYL